MPCFLFLKINYTAFGLFVLFALIFVGLIGMYIYSLKLHRKTNLSATKFSLDMKDALDKLNSVDSKLLFIKQTEERIQLQESYTKNPEGRDLLLSKVYQHKAAVLFKANRQQEAITACNQILSVEPSHVQTYLNRGFLFGEIGDYSRGIADFGQAELLDSHNPNIYNNRGWMYLQLKEYSKALSDFDYAISLEPTDIEYLNRGNTYKELGEWNKSLADYREGLALHNHPGSELHAYLVAAISEVEKKVDEMSVTTES